MNKLQRNPNWLALHSDSHVREMILQLCAQGKSNGEIAELVRQSGLVDIITPEDVDYYKKHNAREINAYLQRNAKDVLGAVTRSNKSFRLGEMDALSAAIIKNVYGILETEPSKAVPLMKVYVTLQEQIGKQSGDLQGDTGQTNTYLEAMQDGTPEERTQLARLIADVDVLVRAIKRRKIAALGLPEARVIEAEFTAEDGT